jgi:predicted small metal-binding protein
MGADCDFEAEGDSIEEVKKKMTDHAMSDHKEMMEKMSSKEKEDMMMKMEEKMETIV